MLQDQDQDRRISVSIGLETKNRGLEDFKTGYMSALSTLYEDLP